MTRTKTPVRPAELAKYRAIERVAPGAWLLAEFPTEGGRGTEEIWVQVRISMDLTHLTTGRKRTRVFGRCTDGQAAEVVHWRGTQVRSLTAAQATRCGLVVPEPAPEPSRIAAAEPSP